MRLQHVSRTELPSLHAKCWNDHKHVLTDRLQGSSCTSSFTHHGTAVFGGGPKLSDWCRRERRASAATSGSRLTSNRDQALDIGALARAFARRSCFLYSHVSYRLSRSVSGAIIVLVEKQLTPLCLALGSSKFHRSFLRTPPCCPPILITMRSCGLAS